MHVVVLVHNTKFRFERADKTKFRFERPDKTKFRFERADNTKFRFKRFMGITKYGIKCLLIFVKTGFYLLFLSLIRERIDTY